jgi:hypothetical protein
MMLHSTLTVAIMQGNLMIWLQIVIIFLELGSQGTRRSYGFRNIPQATCLFVNCQTIGEHYTTHTQLLRVLCESGPSAVDYTID